MERFPAPRIGTPRAILLILLTLSGCRSGGQILSIEEQISTFDPRVEVTQSTEQIQEMLFNGLTKIDAHSQPIPDLAESFSASPDLASHVFRLRPGVRFHNDHILTSLDVKYTFETMLSDNFQSERRLKLSTSLIGIEVPDVRTVAFKCSGPCPDLPAELAAIGIIPEGTSRLQAETPIGTGPYRLESGDNSRGFILVAHQDYFGARPAVRRLEVRVGPTTSPHH